jgi:hypothetical protein
MGDYEKTAKPTEAFLEAERKAKKKEGSSHYGGLESPLAAPAEAAADRCAC